MEKKSLGIYISPSEICISQVRIGADLKPDIEHLVKFPTGFAVREGMLRPLSLNSEFFDEKAAWVNTFIQEVKKVDWDYAPAVVTLSQQFAILRYFVMPSMEKRFWSKSIPLESKKYIPISFEEVIYDFNAVHLADPKKLGVLFGLTQRKSVEFILNTLKAAGLKLSAVETNSASLERLLAFADPKGHDSKGYVHFSGSSAIMLFSHGGFPVLYRETEVESAGTMTDRRRLDVKGAVQFVDRYVGGKDYSTLALSGDGVDSWIPSIEKEAAPIAVQLWDAAKACSLKDNDAASMFSVGAALKSFVPGRLKLDISGISTAAMLEKQAQNYVLRVTAVLGGFLLLLSLMNEVRLLAVNSKISALQSQVLNVPELEGNDNDAIRAKIDVMNKNIKMFASLRSDADSLAPKLAAIADRITPDLWVTDIQYLNPISISEAQGASKELKISGETMLKGETRMRAVDAFSKSLKTAAEFKIFTPPLGGVEYTIEPDSPDSEAMGFSPGPSIQKAGVFSIICTSKKK